MVKMNSDNISMEVDDSLLDEGLTARVVVVLVAVNWWSTKANMSLNIFAFERAQELL